MKSPDWKNCTERDLWEYVACYLADQQISTILVGGAVVAIYSEGAYRSGDLDFVCYQSLEDLEKHLFDLGLLKKGRYYFHPECKHLYIDFVSGPLGIGDDLDIKPAQRKINGRVIKILSPTDCIRDRLASYIHFGNRSALDQALLVAQNQNFKLGKIKEWCESEEGINEFEEFQKLLKKKLK